MPVLDLLERLDHRLAGMPETAYVYEARKHRLRIALSILLGIVALLTLIKTPVAWLVVALAVAAALVTVAGKRTQGAGAASEAGRWYET